MATTIVSGEIWSAIRTKINGNTAELVNDKADKSDTYTKTEVNGLLPDTSGFALADDVYTKLEIAALIPDISGKADSVDVYTKSETDILLNGKANIGTSYTKAESNALLSLKADLSVVYTQSQVNALIPDVSGKADLDDVYLSATIDALLANKTNVGVSYTKAEADTLLTAKADAATTYTMVQVDGLIPDVTGKADKTNVLELDNTTEFTPTLPYHPVTKVWAEALAIEAGGSDIDDTVTSAVKTWSSTQIDGLLGDKADVTALPDISGKADIGDSYTKSEADTLLAAKMAIVDAYTKTDVDTLLTAKSNTADVYSKSEVDTLIAGIDGNINDESVAPDSVWSSTKITAELADKITVGASYSTADTDNLLALKADVVNVYTKADITTLLAPKANTADVYTQAQVDALIPDISGKADLGVSYTKAEADTLLAAKSDNGDSYLKAETDALLVAKADTTTTYTRTVIDTSLAIKADTTTTYTKTEVDGLIPAIVDGSTETDEVWSGSKISTDLASKIGTGDDATLGAVIVDSLAASGGDGTSRVGLVNNSSYTPSAGEYSLFFEAGILKMAINGVKQNVGQAVPSDTTDPVVALGSDTTHDGTGTTFTITAAMITEDNLDTVQYRFDSDSYTTATLPQQVTVPSDTSNHTLDVIATDTSSNTGSDSLVFTYVAPSTFIIDEDFDDIGAPSGWDTNGTVDFDYTPALVGSSSVYVTGGDSRAESPTFTSEDELWVRCRFKVSTAPTTGDPAVLRLYSGATDVADMKLNDTGVFGTTVLAANSYASTTYNTSDTYYIWLHYTRGASNGELDLYVSTTTTRPGTPDKARTGLAIDYGITDIWLHSGYGSAVIFDTVQVSDTDPGDF